RGTPSSSEGSGSNGLLRVSRYKAGILRREPRNSLKANGRSNCAGYRGGSLGIVNDVRDATVPGQRVVPQLETRSQAPLRRSLFQAKGSPERIHDAFGQLCGVLRGPPKKDMPVNDRAKKQRQRQVDIEIGRELALLDRPLDQALQFVAGRFHHHVSPRGAE